MSTKHAIILGGGISGLSLAWYLGKQAPHLQLTLLEKEPRLGGWIHTSREGGFLFEQGPRTFPVAKSPYLVSLCHDLELEILTSQGGARVRYLWAEGALHRFPSTPWEFLRSPLTRGCVFPLLFEWSRKRCVREESVWEFAKRRFGTSMAQTFFSPLVRGIFGGDSREICAHACLATLKKWEEKYGSVTRGWLREGRGGSSAIGSFRGGMEEIIHHLTAKSPASILRGSCVHELARLGDKWKVETSTGTYEADLLFSALPVHEVVELFRPVAPALMEQLASVHSLGLSVVNVGYQGAVLPYQGFGYLTQGQEDLCGVIFDSCVFPEHNLSDQQTRLTILSKKKNSSLEEALEGVRRLGITQEPDVIIRTWAEKAIPQYGVGHQKRMKEWEGRFLKEVPAVQLVGNYLEGVSLEQCVRRAHFVALRNG